MNTKTKKVESGAELLARLQSRPSLQHIDPFIFGLNQSQSVSSNTTGQLVELFGPEGVGKSEMALHLVSKVCLPERSPSGGVEIGGLGAKAIIVNTDYKFSILRLAIILEKQIQDALKKSNKNCSTNSNLSADIASCVVCKHGEQNNLCNKCVRTTNKNTDDVIKSKDDHDNFLNSKNRDNSDNTIKIKEMDAVAFTLSNSEIEDIIQQSLQRILVLTVSSSQQLLASLMSLETTLAEDNLFSLLVIDSISAFYFIDKAIETVDSSTSSFSNFSNNSNHGNNKPPFLVKNKIMLHITDVISSLVTRVGISCLAISSAFFTGSGKNFQTGWKTYSGAYQNTTNSSNNNQTEDGSSSTNTTSNDFNQHAWMSSEYLGKCWVSCRNRRISLTRKDDCSGNNVGNVKGEEGNAVMHAMCSVTQKVKGYVIYDDLLKAL